ncbi:MAG: hypothetical protein K2Y23_25225 [Cyanobacteria bacterium]|nr:hypothetical protein [Cyanobacteriota bacterium]
MTDATVVREPDASLVTTLHVTYLLHAVGLAIGAFGTSTIVGAFIFGWPSIIAVIINYVKRADAQDTWLESHFAWQISTFWQAVGWSLLVLVIGIPLILLLGLGFIVMAVGFFVLGVWAVYRIAKGWSRLNDRRAV